MRHRQHHCAIQELKGDGCCQLGIGTACFRGPIRQHGLLGPQCDASKSPGTHKTPDTCLDVSCLSCQRIICLAKGSPDTNVSDVCRTQAKIPGNGTSAQRCSLCSIVQATWGHGHLSFLNPYAALSLNAPDGRLLTEGLYTCRLWHGSFRFQLTAAGLHL